MDEANPWEPSPWTGSSASAPEDAQGGEAGTASAGLPWGAGASSPHESHPGDQNGHDAASPVSYDKAAPWGASEPAPDSPVRSRNTQPPTPSTAGIDPPAWGSANISAVASPVKESIRSPLASSTLRQGPGRQAETEPPLSAVSQYSTASLGQGAWSGDGGESSSPTAPKSASTIASDVSGWGPPIDDSSLGTGSRALPISVEASLEDADTSGGQRTPTSALPPTSNAGLSGWQSSSAGIHADRDQTRLTPVSAGWSAAVGGTGGEGLPPADDLDEESPWGPPPEMKAGEGEERDPKVAESMSASALQATIDKRLYPEQVAEESKGRRPTELKVPPRGSMDKVRPSSGSGRSVAKEEGTQQQATWLARLKATQKGGNTSPSETSGRGSMDTGSAGKRSGEQARKDDKPGFVQTSKQEPPKSGGLAAFLASAKEKVARPKIVSAADDDDDEPPPQTSTTATFSTNPDSANNLLTFDDDEQSRKDRQAGKVRADADPTQPSLVSRWLGGWRGRNQDLAAQNAAGVSEEAYADRMDAGDALTQADLDWLDKTAPAVHSPDPHARMPDSASSLPSRIDVQQSAARTTHLQPPMNRMASDGSSSPGSPLDNWLAQGPGKASAASRAQFAGQASKRAVALQQVPESGLRGGNMTNTLNSVDATQRRQGQQSGRIVSTGSAQGSADIFGDFQTQTFSDWSPSLGSASRTGQNPSNGPLLSPNVGLRTPASAASSKFSASMTSDGFGSLQSASFDKPGPSTSQRAQPGGRRAKDEYDPFESGQAGTIDEDFGRDYRDDDDDDFSALDGGAPGYRDAPEEFHAPPPAMRTAAQRAPMVQPTAPRPAQTPSTHKPSALDDFGDLLGGLEESKRTSAPGQPAVLRDDDPLAEFFSAPKSTSTSTSAPAQARTAAPPGPGQASNTNGATARIGGPLLPPPPGQTRAGGLLPQPPPGSKAGRLGGPSAQQIRGSSTTASQLAQVIQAAPVKKGPSSGQGMTQDDLSFFETL